MTEKAVMISIRPDWCHLIAQGKKTVEVRKTKPEMETPFKCYIYCTLSGCNEFFRGVLGGDVAAWNRSKMADMKGMVFGEFVCDAIFPICIEYSDPNCEIAKHEFTFTGLTDKQIIDYLGNGKEGYGWHISDLMIYEKPRRLNEFFVTDKAAVQMCFNRQLAGQPEYVTKNDGWLKGCYICHKNGEPDWCTKCKTKPLKRPPQSWCYVVEG